jgi:hypothetical protein
MAIYQFKGNNSDMKVYSDSQFEALNKAKESSTTNVELKMRLSKADLKLMRKVSNSISTKSEDLLKDYIQSTLQLIKP